MEICELTDQKFRIILLMNFSELQENTHSQPNKIRKTVCEQNEKFNKEIETI